MVAIEISDKWLDEELEGSNFSSAPSSEVMLKAVVCVACSIEDFL